MKRLRNILFATAALVTIVGSPILAATDALCKANCLSEASQAAVKHLCCPTMKKQVASAEKLVRNCSRCFERQAAPMERTQIQSNPTEPVSVSELGVSEPRDRISVNQKFHNLYSNPIIHCASIPISLHRILV